MGRALRAVPELVAALLILVGVGYLVLQVLAPVRVAGWSMHPALHPGDLVIVRRSRAPRIGEIALVVQSGHTAMLHRVVGVAGDGSLRTRGDANPVDDLRTVEPASVGGTVVGSVALGRAVERWRGGGSLGYDVGSTEQHEATTETTSPHMPSDQGRAP